MARRSLYSAALLSAALSCAPAAARAQLVDRLSVQLEGVVGTLLSSDHRGAYGLGLGFGVRPAVRLAGPLWLHLHGSYGRWAEGGASAGAATLWSFGGGVTLAPLVSLRGGRFLAQVEAGYGLTGAASEGRAVLGAGVGWLIPLGRSVIDLGPVARLGYVLPDTAQSPDAGAAVFWWAGLVVGLRAPLHRATAADRDRDGVLDGDDRCPVMAAGPRPDPRNPGCPAMDRDDDGVADPDDACVEVPAGARPDPARQGCPRVDQDDDGVTDAQDRCPSDPEDRDGFEDADGCPDPDNDRDRVPDAQDRCPNEPEVYNDFEDDDGCQDDPPTAARFDGDQLVLRAPVRFAAGGDAVAPASVALLDRAAELLQQAEGVRRVRVVCNAEAPGDRRARHLARDRARAVAEHLARRGIPHRRISADGATGEPAGAVVITVERGGHSSRASRSSRRHHRRHRER